jgi:hypothetical protein
LKYIEQLSDMNLKFDADDTSNGNEKNYTSENNKKYEKKPIN